MRTISLTLAGLAMMGATALHVQGQEPEASPPAADANKLDTLLKAWETKMQGLQTLYAETVHTSLDKTLGASKKKGGGIWFMKPNKARLELKNPEKPTDWERWICTGNAVYEYQPKQKIIRVYNIAPQNNGQGGQMGGGTFLELLFGMKAQVVQDRYQVRLIKDDDWWIYVEILPKLAVDKQEFSKAQMVFYGEKHPGNVGMLPRRLWFQAPNGDEETWEFPKIMANPEGIKETNFVPPAKPEGWTISRANAPGAGGGTLPANEDRPEPRIVRPSDR